MNQEIIERELTDEEFEASLEAQAAEIDAQGEFHDQFDGQWKV